LIFLILSGLATGASRVAPVDKLSVALVIVFGLLFLGEPLSWAKGVGGLLIVAGAITIALE
jgi:transporter family protein